MFPDRRDPTLVRSLIDMFRDSCEETNYFDQRRSDSAFKVGPRTAAGHRSRSLFLTAAVAPGGCFALARRDPLDLHFRRRIDGRLRHCQRTVVTALMDQKLRSRE
jgi:hypothetical protein